MFSKFNCIFGTHIVLLYSVRVKTKQLLTIQHSQQKVLKSCFLPACKFMPRSQIETAILFIVSGRKHWHELFLDPLRKPLTYWAKSLCYHWLLLPSTFDPLMLTRLPLTDLVYTIPKYRHRTYLNNIIHTERTTLTLHRIIESFGLENTTKII